MESDSATTLCIKTSRTYIWHMTCTCVLDTCCYATMCGISANSGSTIHTYGTCTCVLDTCCYATMCGISANSGSTIHTYGTCTCVLDTCCYATMCGISANSGSTIHTYGTCTCVLDTCCYATMCGISANSSSTIHAPGLLFSTLTACRACGSHYSVWKQILKSETLMLTKESYSIIARGITYNIYIIYSSHSSCHITGHFAVVNSQPYFHHIQLSGA